LKVNGYGFATDKHLRYSTAGKPFYSLSLRYLMLAIEGMVLLFSEKVYLVGITYGNGIDGCERLKKTQR